MENCLLKTSFNVISGNSINLRVVGAFRLFFSVITAFLSVYPKMQSSIFAAADRYVFKIISPIVVGASEVYVTS